MRKAGAKTVKILDGKTLYTISNFEHTTTMTMDFLSTSSLAGGKVVSSSFYCSKVFPGLHGGSARTRISDVGRYVRHRALCKVQGMNGAQTGECNFADTDQNFWRIVNSDYAHLFPIVSGDSLEKFFNPSRI